MWQWGSLRPLTRRVPFAAFAVWSAIAAGCASSAPPDTADPSERPRSAVSTAAAPVASAKPEPSRPPFAVVYQADAQLGFIALDDAVLLETKGALLRLEGDQIHDVTSLLDGLGDPKEGLDWRKSNFVLRSLSGSLAGDLRAHLSVGEDPSNVGRVFQRRNGTWQERAFSTTYSNAAYDESWLSEIDLANGARLYERHDGTRVVLEIDGPKPAVMPAMTRGVNGCDARMVFHSALVDLPDGTLVGAGQACTGKTDRLEKISKTAISRAQPTQGPIAVEMWLKGEAKARFDVLPGNHVSIAGPSFEISGEAGDLWVATQVYEEGDELGAPYLAHFDGSTWKEVTPSCDLPIFHIARTNHAFVFCGHRAYRRDGDAWTQLAPGLQGDHDLFESVATLGQGFVFGLRGDALHRLGSSETTFERFLFPAIDGAKLHAQSMLITAKGEILIAASLRGQGPRSALLRFVAPR